MTKLSPARSLAVQVGAAVRTRDAFASDVLDARLSEMHMAKEDRAFARLLALGVASSWGTLDEVIDRCLRKPDDVKPDVRDALRVSTYELLFLDKDSYAAVDQGVELARSIAPRASGLANAVLRKVVAAAKEFPFGNPDTDDAALARFCAFPYWLCDLLIAQMGRPAARLFMEASNKQAPVFIGVNVVKAGDAAILKLARDNRSVLQSVSLLPQVAVPGCYHLADSADISNKWMRELFDKGKILVSDAVAQHITALALPEKQPESFLEIGSGRGTKTILLQSDAVRRYGRQMKLVAVDSVGFKTDLLRKRAAVYGTKLEDVVKADARNLQHKLASMRFDGVLLDSPCSGLGTLRRHPEIRWRLKPEDLKRMADLSFDLISEAATYVKTGGLLTYATCTVNSFENEYVIKRFLETDSGKNFRIVPCPINNTSKLFLKSVLTEAGCDAHFAAQLIRVK